MFCVCVFGTFYIRNFCSLLISSYESLLNPLMEVFYFANANDVRDSAADELLIIISERHDAKRWMSYN